MDYRPDVTMAGTRPYVFISYASVDRDQVMHIVEVLQRAGVAVWIDFDNIAAGANYGLEIVQAIEGCSAFMLMCTPAAISSRNVRQEIQIAWKADRRYLPLLLQPTTFTKELEYWLEGYQWVEVLDRPEDQWLPRLLRAIRRLGGEAAAPSSGAGAAAPASPTPSSAAPSPSGSGAPTSGSPSAGVFPAARPPSAVPPPEPAIPEP